LVTVIDIASRDILLLKPSMKIGEILPKMKELRIRDAPVVGDDNRIIGVVSYRGILMKGVGRDAKVQSVMDPPFYIYEDADINNAISNIVTWKVREIPIINKEGIVVGIISRDNLLRHLIENNRIPRANVTTVMSKPVITINEKESIARARWLMLKSGISRLPVIDSVNRVIGVITLSDIVERLYMIRLSRRKGFEWIQSEESFLAAPVSDFMTSPPITIPNNVDIAEATIILLDNRISGAPVVSSNDVAEGIVSGIDILKKYLESFTTIQPIEAKISEAIEDELTRTQIEKLVNSYLSKFSRYVKVIDFKLTVKQIGKVKEMNSEKRRQYDVSIKLSTNITTISTNSRCWDLATCVREVLSIAEKRLRRIIDKKGAKAYNSRERGE